MSSWLSSLFNPIQCEDKAPAPEPTEEKGGSEEVSEEKEEEEEEAAAPEAEEEEEEEEPEDVSRLPSHPFPTRELTVLAVVCRCSPP